MINGYHVFISLLCVYRSMLEDLTISLCKVRKKKGKGPLPKGVGPPSSNVSGSVPSESIIN